MKRRSASTAFGRTESPSLPRMWTFFRHGLSQLPMQCLPADDKPGFNANLVSKFLGICQIGNLQSLFLGTRRTALAYVPACGKLPSSTVSALNAFATDCDRPPHLACRCGSPPDSARDAAGRRWRLLGLLIAGTLLWFVGLGSTDLAAQERYKPTDEVVENMVRRGLAFLEANPQGHSGEAVLAGLTVVEATKRYERQVPREHPLVQNAVAHILDDIAKKKEGKDSRLNVDGIYYPALSVILLLTIGDETYRPEIEFLVDHLFSHRTPYGAFSYSSGANGDVSQSQYAALAFTVLKLHGYKVYANESRDLLEWFCRTVSNEGSWFYHYRGTSPAMGETEHRNSLHVAGLGSVYLLADLLNLNPRRPKGKGPGGGDADLNGGLPPSVSIYVPPKSEDDPRFKDGPLVNFDAGLMNSTKSTGNRWLAGNFRYSKDQLWNYYFMYGMERYAYFREKAENRISEVPTWYDQGVDFLMSNQEQTGCWIPPAGGHYNTNNSTCFAVLFLVRASELLMEDALSGQVAGNQGFKADVKIDNKNGEVASAEMVKGVEDIMTLLKTTTPDDDLDMLMNSLAPAIKEFTTNKSLSRTEQSAFLQGLMSDENNMRRKIAVKFISSSQDLDNVPALLYALTDPDLEICAEAHKGLRLISRKVDAFPISDKPNAAEFLELKRKWTAWFKAIRPDAKLFDE